MRLIDADALIAEYDRVHVGPPGGARKLIEDAQTVQPHTCLDCIHWKEYKAVGRICDFHDWVSRETDYCSLWEEKK